MCANLTFPRLMEGEVEGPNARTTFDIYTRKRILSRLPLIGKILRGALLPLIRFAFWLLRKGQSP